MAREGLQRGSQTPRVLLDLDLPLPLAFFVGYEWRLTTRLRLDVRLRTGTTLSELSGDGDVVMPPEPVREPLAGGGPVVLAVSCREGLGHAARRYAAESNAQELITIHMPGILAAPALRGLARACARELRAVNDRGIEKHLLLLGPSSFAVLAGASANATGPVTIPFWDGQRYAARLVAGR